MWLRSYPKATATVDDLKVLSTDGFTLTVGAVEQSVHAALATISGDNLSAHMIGGFSMSFNSRRVCRHCMGTYTDIKEKFQEDSYVLRRDTTGE